MRKKIGKQVLSFVMAVELFCAPLAMAMTQRLQEVPETPKGDEVVAARPQAAKPTTAQLMATPAEPLVSSEIVPYQYVYTYYGTDAAWVGEGGYYGPETTVTGNNWGWSGKKNTSFTGTLGNPPYVQQDNVFYFYEADPGRVPDLEFEGYYIFQPAARTDLLNGSKWAVSNITAAREKIPYSLSQGTPIKLNDVYGTVANDQGNLVDAAGNAVSIPAYVVTPKPTTEKQVGAQLFALNSTYINAIYKTQLEAVELNFNLPVTGRWVASSHSDVLELGMAITDTSNHTVEVQQLLTKPFKEAGDSDKIGRTAVSYSEVVTGAGNVASRDPNTNEPIRQNKTRNVFDMQSAAAAGKDTFWLRVNPDQETMTLSLRTYEPYYDYTVAGKAGVNCPVEVTYSFNGVEETLPLSKITGEALPKATTGESWNSLDDPARGQWTLVDIPLRPASEATGSDLANTITVTVKSPNAIGITADDDAATLANTTETTYTFYVERLVETTSALELGNSPVGLILRDTAATWANVPAGVEPADVNGDGAVDAQDYIIINKNQAKATFGVQYTFQNMPLIPRDQDNAQQGSIYKGTYSPLAWMGTNLDLSETAVFAYQDAAFQDPGVRFTDCQGLRVVFGEEGTAPYDTSVTRTIQLAQPLAGGPLKVEQFTDPTLRETCWYVEVEETTASGPVITPKLMNAAQLAEAGITASQTLRNADGSDLVDLRGLNVLPGVYTITYTFTDPINGAVDTITRPLVILPVPGDVDMDGAVTMADAAVIEAQRSQWQASADPVARLVLYRVADCIRYDAAGYSSGYVAIQKGFQPAKVRTDNGGDSDYLYLPLSDGGAGEKARKNWAAVNSETALTDSDAHITLEFLGVETGKLQESGVTTAPSGPWSADKTAGVSIAQRDDMGNYPYDTAQGDTFWMGVKLTNMDAFSGLSGRQVENLTISLIYDSRYVKPAFVYTDGGLSTDEEKLKDMLYTYSMDASRASAESIWCGLTGADYARNNILLARPYATHYSKVISDLETTAMTNGIGADRTSYLKELTVTFVHFQNRTYATLKNGYLLAVPFTLIKHPTGVAEGQSAQLVELGAGMRDFTLISPTASGSFMNSILLDAESGQETLAFSAQESIYGEATRNVRDGLAYESQLVPIGKNKTTIRTLANQNADPNQGPVDGTTVYDEYFRVTNLPMNGVLQGELPPGLTFSNTTGQITGIAERAGTYEFSINDNFYRIVVQKKTVRYFVYNSSSYYGEEEFRGLDHSDDFSYGFYLEDLSIQDQGKLVQAGAYLSANAVGSDDISNLLDGFVAPKFWVCGTDTGFISDVITKTTPVGSYKIMAEAEAAPATNYDFQYVTLQPKRPGSDVQLEAGSFNILRRPVAVESITMTYEQSGLSMYADTEPSRLAGQSADEAALRDQQLLDADGTIITLAFDPNYDPRFFNTYEGHVLSGSPRVGNDVISLTYAGQFQKLPTDIPTDAHGNVLPGFKLTSLQEERDIGAIGSLKLTGECAKNYELIDDDPIGTCSIKGLVIRRGVTSMHFADDPHLIPMEFKNNYVIPYGDRLQDHTQLFIYTVQGAHGEVFGDFRYNSDMIRPLEVHFNWVSGQDYLDGTSPENLTKNVGTGWLYDPDNGVNQDLCPYGPETVFTTDMDGWYLCAVVTKYTNDSADTEYLKDYLGPIRVARRALTLHLDKQERYYGESDYELNADGTVKTDANGDPISVYRYTYTVNHLTLADQEWLKNELGVETLQGTQEELETLLADTIIHWPVIRAVTDLTEGAEAVTAESPVPLTGNYFLTISEGEDKNYAFRYENIGEGVPASFDQGSTTLTVRRRPIIIQSVTPPKAAGTPTGVVFPQTIYADSHTLAVNNQTIPVVENGVQNVTFARPGVVDAHLTYYPAGGSSVGASKDTPFRDNGTVAVLEKDLGKMNLSYSLSYLPDQGHGIWYTFAQNYFGLDTFDAYGNAYKPVEISNMTLMNSGLENVASNYILVYPADDTHRSDFWAQKRAPADAVIASAPNPLDSAGNEKTYLKYGVAQVVLRPIESMSLVSLCRTDYNYGDPFGPEQINPNGNTNFVVQVNYATHWDDVHHFVGNQSTERVTYQLTGSTDTFAERGFTIGFIDSRTATDAQKSAALAAGQTLVRSEEMLSQVHDGKYLFVAGKRGANDPTVYSAPGVTPLTVHPASLTLTAQNVHRYYGESNTVEGPLSFTFNIEDLAGRDKTMLGKSTGMGTAADLQTLQTKWAAQGENFGYRAPTFNDSAAVKNAAVNPDLGYGQYPLELIKTANLTNYIVNTQNASVYVYPRPIQISAFSNSQADPVYTIYNQTTTHRFTTQFGMDRVTVVLPVVGGAATYPCTLADGKLVQLHLTGNALYADATVTDADSLKFNAEADFVSTADFDWTLGTDDTDLDADRVTVTFQGLVAGDTANNYNLLNPNRSFERCWGSVKLRTIGHLYIKSLPKLDYLYGETLDLSGLRVQIAYLNLNGELDPSSPTVNYEGPDQFASYGLYVNYWTPGDPLPAENKWKDIQSSYRKAHSGDHVTIAPTHDTQQYIGSTSTDPLRQPFAHNGMSLIISGYQPGANQEAATPKIIGRTMVDVDVGHPSYEAGTANDAGVNNPIATITVRPLRLQFNLSAQDKTYDGDTRGAGTLTLTNLYDRTVQTRVDNANIALTDHIQDAVYIPLGASYEIASTDLRSKDYRNFNTLLNTMRGGAVAFNTGIYRANKEAPLLQNGAVEWADGYTWGQGLTFTFPNANVHYEDDTFVSGQLPGVGTAELAAYWEANQAENAVTDQWDRYAPVSAMPVEVTNIVLAGPDAANYTFGENGTSIPSTSVLMTTRAAGDRGQASAPYATIHKANRATIQTLSGGHYDLPQLEVDQHTNVIRMTYGQDLSALGDNNNRPGTTDDYRGELHFEYSLMYQDPDGLMAHWAGVNGNQDYQDTLFFGGETYRPAVASAYYPDVERMPLMEDANESTIYKGQRYRWAALDTGVSDRGYVEDEGFWIDTAAYPGSAVLGGDVARSAYWHYDLYNTDRQPLPRDTVYYPLVRLSETHNYLASGTITGAPDVTAEAMDAARKAVAAMGADGENSALRTAAETASTVLFGQTGAMKTTALEIVQQKMDEDWALGDSGKYPKLDKNNPLKPEQRPTAAAASAVKSYRQRLDIVSTATLRSADKNDKTDYLLETLEDMCFTNTLEYPESDFFSAVLYNSPFRYYDYFWDVDESAAIKFDKRAPIDFSGPIGPIEIRKRTPEGDTVDMTIMVNEPTLDSRGMEVYTTRIYAQVESNGNRLVRFIKILPTALYARLGDEPYQLVVETVPALPSNRVYTWTSSDNTVATVDEKGLVTFRGVGECIITVSTTNRRSFSIKVVVSATLPITQTDTYFNFDYPNAYMTLDENNAFRPKEGMTRSQVVELIDLLFDPESQWSATNELAYVDITGRERYYEALKRLSAVGIVVGLPGGSFSGEQPITRAEFITMLARMLKLNIVDTAGGSHIFADSTELHTWAYSYIDAMAGTGIVRGVGGGSFAPNRVLTREEAAAFIARLLTVGLDPNQPGLKTPSDMTPENWSYQSVLRAVNSIAFPE